MESLWPPALVISNARVSTSGQVQLEASGPSGQTVVLESSPDLKTWIPVGTNTLLSGATPLIDPQPAQSLMRFYRLHLK